MTQRDELAELIRANRAVWVTNSEHAQMEARQADAILTAGYSRPKQVTTVAELDALPVGSVVLHNGRAFQHYPAYPAPFDEYQKWKCGDGGFVRSTKDDSTILPATVLYSPAVDK